MHVCKKLIYTVGRKGLGGSRMHTECCYMLCTPVGVSEHTRQQQATYPAACPGRLLWCPMSAASPFPTALPSVASMTSRIRILEVQARGSIWNHVSPSGLGLRLHVALRQLLCGASLPCQERERAGPDTRHLPRGGLELGAALCVRWGSHRPREPGCAEAPPESVCTDSAGPRTMRPT